MLPSDAGTSELQADAALDDGQSNSATLSNDSAKLKDALKTSVFIICMITTVLYIVLAWYFFVLKPALFENIPMEIKLAKKLFSDEPSFKKPEFKKADETQIAESLIKSSNASNEAVEKQQQPEIALHKKPVRQTNLTKRKASIKFAKSNKGAIEKVAMTQTQGSPILQDGYEVENNKKGADAENMRAEESSKEQNNQVAQEIKSFAIKWKESILTPATQPTCTQVQIAMNQCPN